MHEGFVACLAVHSILQFKLSRNYPHAYLLIFNLGTLVGGTFAGYLVGYLFLHTGPIDLSSLFGIRYVQLLFHLLYFEPIQGHIPFSITENHPQKRKRSSARSPRKRRSHAWDSDPPGYWYGFHDSKYEWL